MTEEKDKYIKYKTQCYSNAKDTGSGALSAIHLASRRIELLGHVPTFVLTFLLYAP